MVIQENPQFPELNASIKLANAYIRECQGIGMLSEFSKDLNEFQEALEQNIGISVVDIGNQAFARIHAGNVRLIELNSRFIAQLKAFEVERRNIDIDDDEYVLLVFFFSVILVHEYCHFLVRFGDKTRATPKRLRIRHRGRLMDAGHSFEIKLFNGILRMVSDLEGKSLKHLILEMHVPELKRFKVDPKVIRRIVEFTSPLGNLFESDVPQEYFEGKSEHIFECFDDLDEKEPLLPEEEIPSDSKVLRDLGLDPETHKILRFDDENCIFSDTF
jgi:hypothetical protein